MAKSYEKLDYFGKEDFLRNEAKKYGINTSDYSQNQRESGNFGTKGSYEDLERDVLNASRSDNSTGQAIMAGKMSGNDRFKDVGDGISSMSELFTVSQAMKKTHKDMGNTGNFSSANDLGNVASHLSREYEDSFRNSFDTGKETKDTDDVETLSPSETVLSQEAQDILNFNQGARPNPFSKSAKDFDYEGMAYNPNTGKDSEEGGDFLDNYKVNVQKGLQLSGIPTRGPNSLNNATRTD